MFPAFESLNSKPSKIAETPSRPWLEHLAQFILERALRRSSKGALIVEFPDGRRERYGEAEFPHPVRIKINRLRAFSRTLREGALGLGESYVDGDWDSEDLAEAMRFFLNNWDALDERKLNFLKRLRRLNPLSRWFRRHGRQDASTRTHYDLSNELFKLFLDPSMTYSSAIFDREDMSLEEAQALKVDTILKKARLRQEDIVLEIGSGWGALALRAAERYGCQVTSLTQSDSQRALADERRARSRSGDNVRFELSDFRQAQGRYTRIISVETLETVGHRCLPEFFAACDRLLADDGVMVLQVITFPDNWYDEYLRREDWIQKHVSPLTYLPSLSAMLDAIKRSSNLVVEEVQNIAPHYAKTISLWRRRFVAAKNEVLALGYDERFFRTWDYYLASCEAEFATRWLQVLQIVLTRPNNLTLNRAEAAEVIAFSPKRAHAG